MGGQQLAGGRRVSNWRAAATGMVMRTAGLLMVVLVAALAMAAAIALGVGAATAPDTTPELIAQPPAPTAERPGTEGDEADEQVADPVRIRIPAIGVDAPVDPLVVDENGVLPPPDTFQGTGWWQDGPEPGEVGPAVIAGHIDSYTGPAVFFRLDQLDSGDEIFVDRADGTTAVFLTQHTERHDKNDFPTRAVYGDTRDAQLRLITCGGEFDEDDRRYLDNVITYAILAG